MGLSDRQEPEHAPSGYRADEAAANARRRRTALALVLSALLLVIVGAAGSAAVLWSHLFEGMPAQPDAEELWALGREPAVEVLARDGTVIGQRGPSYARRVPVEEMPDHLVSAFLAAEDQRFYSHGGVDLPAVVRAALANWRAGEAVQGGSTITQQLVKNLVVGPERTLRRKAQEARLAMALERRMTKDEILELYLNRVYLGERAYGVEAASQRYFDKSAREVTLSEAALLAALPKAPTRLSPADNLDAARARAALVLNRMERAGFLTAAGMVAALEAPADLAAPPPPSEAPDPGYGYVIDEAVRAARRLAPDAPDLVIRTTIDTEEQAQAAQALNAVLAAEGAASRASQGAVVALDYSGEILALAGGRDYAQSQFNRATQALRQPGSAFKPFVYATAFELGMRPATLRDDEPLAIGEWEPANFGGGHRGRVTLEEAFIRSINTVAAALGRDVGPATVAEMARRLGVETTLNPQPSIALGASELTLLELTSAYSVFARDGALVPAHLVTEISDTSGRVLYSRPEVEPRQVYEARLARLMTGMMRGVVTRGTGTRAALAGRAAAGKTGTSQDYRDAWFVGYTGNLVTGVWVGNDDDSSMNGVTGGRLPAMVWHDFMEAAEAGREPAPLNAPPEDATGRNARMSALYSELAAAFARVSGPMAAE